MNHATEKLNSLDDPGRFGEISSIIQSKAALRLFYSQIYKSYLNCLEKVPGQGMAIEFGAGAGFVKSIVPTVSTSDIIPYEGVDLVLDVQNLSLKDTSLRAAFFTNVLHHVPDPEKMFSELSRVLIPGGRVLIIDQYPGWFSRFILKYAHHEPFLPNAVDWKFETTGPLSGANGALAWIIFYRDRSKFEAKFPKLKIISIERHSPLFYWLSGGLKSWSLIPGVLAPMFWKIDQIMGKCLPESCSFVTIELQRD